MQNPTIETKKTIITLLILMLFSITTFAQVGVNTTTPDASSMLDITATNKGLLIPRIALISNNDVTTIAAPTNSLLIYNTATVTGANAIVPGYYYYQIATTSWLKLMTGNGAALQYFAESRNTAAPNAIKPVHKFAAIGAETDIDIALTPKGNGAITAQVADNTLTGGNKRGFFAVDLQMNRDSNSQVASGSYSTVIGRGNTASAVYSTAIGQFNTASGAYSTALGGDNGASGYNSTAFGEFNTASGVDSTVMGVGNTAQSRAETALGSFGTTGTGSATTIVATDRLLNVGNGTLSLSGTISQSDAFTILKNGNTGIGNNTPAEKLVVNNGNVAIANNNNTAGTLKFAEPSTSGTNTTTFKAGVQAADINYTLPTTAPTASQVLSSDAAGNMSWATPASTALQYFAESRDVTTAINDVKPVHKFAAIGSETNIDIALTPKGNGAITAQVADNAIAGGNKRGNGAVDLQMERSQAKQVASGTNATILGGAYNEASGNYATAFGNSTTASGNNSTAIGQNTSASGQNSTAMGSFNIASGIYSTVFGNSTDALGDFSTAFGYLNRASGVSSTVMGKENIAQSFGETALGIYGTTGTGNSTLVVATDRLLNVGNGTGTSTLSDALTILKNGNTGIGNNTPSEKLVVNNGNVAIANNNNTAGTLKFAEPSTSGTNTTTFKAGVQAADINYTLPLTAPTASQVLSSDAAGNLSWATPASGSALQYFAESRDVTAGINDVKPVHKLAAIGTETDVDIALTPKGNGAITAQVADNTATGGNKRGSFAVDLQTSRIAANQVASSGYSAVLGGRSNIASGSYAISVGGLNNVASGYTSIAMGENSNASASLAIAMGLRNTASGYSSLAMGRNNTAQSYGETALGIFGTTGSGSASTIVATDRLLNVGNGGAFPGNTSDAFTILKNGNTGIGNNTPSEKLVVNNGSIAIENNNNTAGTLKFAEPSTSGTNTTTFKAGVQAANINYILPLTAPTASQVLSSDAAGNMSWATPASSALQYFAESRNTAAPNATVPVHKFAAIGTETNIDIALSPKGNGAITAQTADNTVTGGNKRGVFAVDLQTSRSAADQVASGIGAIIMGGETNKASGNYATVGGNSSNATARGATAIGYITTAAGDSSTALGNSTVASGDYSTAIGRVTIASGFSSTAMGSSTTASGIVSTVMGLSNTAQSYGETALGIFGTTGAGTTESIASTDRLFNVGNGSFGSRSDAFTILKNGNTGIGNNTPSEKLVVNNGSIAIANNNNTAGTLKFAEPSTSGTNTTTFKAGVQAADINYTLPLTAPTASQVLSSDASGNMSWATPASSALQYFAESRNIAAPNATVPVHKFAAIGTETNIDIALSPKGNGAITAQTADNTATGGNKRGVFAVDLQTSRSAADQVASGTNATILGGANNKVTSDFGSAIGSSNTVGGLAAIAIGTSNVTTANVATAIGQSNNVSGVNATAIGQSNTASGSNATAIGNGTTASGSNAVALGQTLTASGQNAIAMGQGNGASGNYSTVTGQGNNATGPWTNASGFQTTATGNAAVAMGYGTTASSFVETALGTQGTIVAGDPNNFVATDRLLNVGNGSSGRSDALTILKNGNTGIGNSTPSEKLVVNNGNVAIANTNNAAGTLKFAEPSTSGINTTTFKAGVQAADINYTLPLTAPTVNQMLISDAAGAMSWLAPSVFSWSRTGNTGNVAGTNFLGNIDDVALEFKINNSRAGFVGNTANYNTFFGLAAGNAVTTGDGNTAMGRDALKNCTTCASTVAIGQFALGNSQNNFYNVAIGGAALQYIVGSSSSSLGSNNTAVGADSGKFVETGNYNTFIGRSTATVAALPTIENSTAIGFGTVVDSSYKVVIGAQGVNSIGGPVAWTNYSDERFKYNIKNNVLGLEFIKRLKPVTYQFDYKKLDDFYHKDDKNKDENNFKLDLTNANNRIQSGFMAQDIEKLCKEMNFEFGAVDKPQDASYGIFGLRYSTFVLPLVKAVQEQQDQIEVLKDEVKVLKDLVQQLINKK